MLHHAEPRHLETGFEIGQRLSVVLAQAVEDFAADRIVESLENRIHKPLIGE